MLEIKRHQLTAFATASLMALLLASCGGGGGSAGGGGGGNHAGSEGTLTNPVILSAGQSHMGTVSASAPSYYQFDSLTGGATYSVTFSNVSGSIIPFLYSSNGQANLQSCFYGPVSATASCIVQASPVGNVFIQVADFSTSASTYTLSAALAVDSGQGLPTAPAAIALGSTYNGALTAGVSTTTYDTGNSGYYTITGLTGNHSYQITLTANAGSARLHAYQSSYSAEAVQACRAGISCTITAAGTSVLLQVRATDSSTFSITSADLGAVPAFTSQGAVGSEVQLQLDGPTYSGSVNLSKSYYTVTRLVPGQSYDAYLTSLGDNVGLYVYSDSGYAQLACSSTKTGISRQACAAIPNAASQLWLVADGSGAQSYLGSNYGIGLQRVAPTQGTITTPQPVGSTDLPFRVNWSNSARSYYQITGLAANANVMVTIAPDHVWGSDYGNLSVYPATGFGSSTAPSTAVCQTQNNTQQLYGSCTATTDASGNLYVSLDAGYFPTNLLGGTSYINVKTVPVNEGNATAPLAKNMAALSNAFTGQVAGGSTSYSYYELYGLTANTTYFILAGFGSDGQSAAISVYNSFSGNLSTQTAACGSSWSYLNNGCTATSDASGRLWVQIGGWYSDHGTNFKLEAIAVPANQGSSSAPVNITGSLPYRATISNGSSYYTATGLVAGGTYEFSRTDTSGGESISVYDDSALTSLVCSGYTTNLGRETDCRGVSTSGTAYVVTNGSSASYYYLNITAVPAFQGTPASPVAYGSTGSSLAGTVNVGASYYHATLSPNTTYTISLTGVTGDPDLYVFNSSAMTGASTCSSLKGINASESCRATSDASGNLWVTVDGELSHAGGSYTLKIQ